MERPEPSVRALVASLLPLVFFTSLARASDLPLALDWEAPELCGSKSQLLAEVANIVGQVEQREIAPVRARATVEPLEDGSFQVVLVTEVEGNAGERILVGRDCDEVRASTALILALMINPEASLDAPSASSEPAEAPEPKPERDPKSSAQRGPSRGPAQASRSAPEPAKPALAPTPTEPQYLLGAGAIGGLGVLPKASVGGELRLGIFSGGLVLELQAAGWLRRTDRVATPPGAGGEFGLVGANLLAGYRALPWDGGEVRLALGVGGRRMRAKSFGVSEPGSATGYWAAALGELSAAQHVSPHALLRVRTGAELPFDRPRFAIRGAAVVHEVGAVGGFVALGLELSF